MELHELKSVSETAEPGVYLAVVDLTDSEGIREEVSYPSREGDNFGLAPQVRSAITAWIKAGNPITSFEEPALVITSEMVNAERDRRIENTFAFEGVAYQLDPQSLQYIAAKGTQAKFAVSNGATPGDLRWASPDADFGWIATDNTVTGMDAQTMSAFADAADQWVTSHIMAAHALKQMDPIPSDFTTRAIWP